MSSIVKALKNKIKEWDKKSFHPLLYPFWMSGAEKNLFDESIIKSKNILEFGSGGSTLRILIKSKARLTSVESDEKWIKALMEYYLIGKHLGKRLFFHHANIGPTGLLGYPLENLTGRDFSLYSREIFEISSKETFDLVFIDGRFRVACALQTVLYGLGKPSMKILIHDYSTRPEYHILEKFLEVQKKSESLCLFTIKNDCIATEVKKFYEEYKLNPY